jgi:hypothetical protein
MQRPRFITIVLGVLFLCVYIAAKIHFFSRFSQLGTTSYLREHSVYWLAMAAIVSLIWLVERKRNAP